MDVLAMVLLILSVLTSILDRKPHTRNPCHSAQRVLCWNDCMLTSTFFIKTCMSARYSFVSFVAYPVDRQEGVGNNGVQGA